ncbi:MAG: transglutaminase domain-containing protein [Candidatus Rokubacteria bacterium]|nr:transglutaminase domain-containing protein [Candidatus Rokubacteria bacterium]
MARALAIVLGLAVGGAAAPASAETLVLQGRMAGRIGLQITERYEPAPGTQWITLKSHRTPSFGSKTWRQRVVTEEVTYSLRPDESSTTTDGSGNTVLTERWERPRSAIEVVRKLSLDTEALLQPLESRAPFPLPAIVAEAAPFLRPTPMAQADDAAIRDLARGLTAGARSEREAVAAVLNHVVDLLRYQYDPPAHDARSALDRRVANCQGYAHLALALLRAAGIPARLTVGASLSKGWRVQHADGTVTFKMGQGRHAWIEVFYPDIGWIPYDPQTSHLFVSIYHVRQAVGLDVPGTVGVLTASPALPRIEESIRGDGERETFAVATVQQLNIPRSFIVAGDLRDVVALPPAPPPPPASAPPPAPLPGPAPPSAVPPPIRRQELIRLVELGNMEFPASLRIFGPPEAAGPVGVVQARRTFIVETADYATGPEELAQAFTLTEPLLLTELSLALQKFGGQTGEVWIDLLEERGRKPGAKIAESRRLAVAGLVERGGYRWVVFDMGSPDSAPVLPPGRYWAVLRSTGDGIFNWYFSLGNAYGDPDDTRSRRRGATDWSNVLNYRFNFRLTGLARP